MIISIEYSIISEVNNAGGDMLDYFSCISEHCSGNTDYERLHYYSKRKYTYVSGKQ
jgi:hypothetical protein